MNVTKGFYDIQANGYAGIDFNQNDLTVEDLHFACERIKEDGVKGILATIITAGFEDMKIRLANIALYQKEDPLIKEIIHGIHIEGPFLNSTVGYRGAHPEQLIFDADPDHMTELLEATNGMTKIVTLAPEKDQGMRTIRMLADMGINVSAGHCNPSLEQLKKAVDAGLNMFTHFGNGIPNMLPRHDNILQRVLSLRKHIWICYIADGIHIPFYVLKNYLDLTGPDHSIVITDCMAGASAPPGRYRISHIELEVGSDGVVREPGKENFAGSSVTMKKCYDNLTRQMGISGEIARKLTIDNPGRFFKTYTN